MGVNLFYQDPDIVKVTIGHLSLEDSAPLLHNDAIKMLFVEYRFLGVPLEETETPFSLPKPQPYTQIAYNFTKGKTSNRVVTHLVIRLSTLLKVSLCIHSDFIQSRINS